MGSFRVLQCLRNMASAMKAMKAVKAMKAMKVTKAMKAMKAMKKTVSKIAKGSRAKASVFRGGKEKTSGGLKKSDIVKSKSGKLVSKKQSAAGKKAYKNIQGWTV